MPHDPLPLLKRFFQNEAEPFRVAIAVLYGSRAGGFPRPDSDLDVAVVFEDEPDEDVLYRRLTDMSLLLSDLTGQETNMMPIYPDFRKPMLYYNAIVQGILIYAKRREDFIFLRKKAIDEMEDFRLFGRQWQAELTRRNLDALSMPEFRYAQGRILDSLRYLSEEMREFQEDYAVKTWQDYQSDRKLQKLIDRTVENILTALIEICGAYLTEEGIAAESYSDVLRKAGQRLGLTDEEQKNMAGFALQRNRLAHRYLNFRWQTIRYYSERRDLISRVADLLLKQEENK